jgi:hypothetical protein
MNNDEINKKIGEILAKSWKDEGYKQKLLADANALLKEEGIPVPAGITVKVVENTASVRHYVLPDAPKEELTDAELDAAAGGSCLFDWHRCVTDSVDTTVSTCIFD